MSDLLVWQDGEFYISTDKALLDADAIYHFLHNDSYWSRGIPRELVINSLDGSALCFGVYAGVPGQERPRQIGLARVISDLATFAYIGDVYILPAYRGRGLGKQLVSSVIAHPALTRLRRLLLSTRDAHTLYERYGGFAPLSSPENMREIRRPYLQSP